MAKKKSETETFCEIREVFQIFDKDNDNYITKAEEQMIFEMFGIPIKANADEEKEEKKDQTEQAEQEEDSKMNQMVEFNEFFDNIHQRLAEAESDEDILESIASNEIESRNDAEHIIKGIISPMFKEQRDQITDNEQEGAAIKRKNAYDQLLADESRKILADFGVYGTNDKSTYCKNLYKSMISKKY
ncbi:MAG: hypothetical protein MJ252_25585 [archaeon]|nr:hypothetical protein [archaeon]